MTTPRDDISGLRKWNDDWPHWQFTEHQHAALRLVLDYAEGAATQLDALRNEINDWANEVARYKSYAEKFDQENDAMQARVKELEAQLAVADATLLRLNSGKELQDMMRLNNDLESRALRAEQERDEAYERAAKVARDAAFDLAHNYMMCHGEVTTQEAESDADDVASAIRRLAVTEKEVE